MWTQQPGTRANRLANFVLIDELRPPTMLQVAAEDPFGPVATTLIEALERDLADRYADRVDDDLGNFVPADATQPRSIFLVAWFGGEAVGCGALRPFDFQTAEVKRMFVVPKLRGRGIGREILREIERHAQDFGYARLCLETGDRQPESVALYTKSGFAVIPPYPPYEHTPHSTCYGKALGVRPATSPTR